MYSVLDAIQYVVYYTQSCGIMVANSIWHQPSQECGIYIATGLVCKYRYCTHYYVVCTYESI